MLWLSQQMQQLLRPSAYGPPPVPEELFFSDDFMRERPRRRERRGRSIIAKCARVCACVCVNGSKEYRA